MRAKAIDFEATSVAEGLPPRSTRDHRDFGHPDGESHGGLGRPRVPAPLEATSLATTRMTVNGRAYAGGANWATLSKRALDLDSVTPLELLAVMLASCAVNVFLLFYLSNVLPWATDYPQQPLFCLMPGYWAPSRTLPINDETEADEVTSTTRFEQAPLADTVVDIRGLTMVFGKNTALSKVNIKIYGSQVTVLLGPNGAGKTTLMTIIAGILKPTSGSVSIYEGETEGTKTTGFCQQFDVLFSDLTVMEHLTYYAKLQGHGAVQLSKMIDETLDAVKLAEKKHSFPPQLSGGMKRRLSMAIALVGKPKLLILDEPTTGMDPETQRSIWELISSLRGTSTILLSTHDIEEAEVLADRIVMMNRGKVVCAGSPTFLKKSSGVGYKLQLSTKTVDYELGAIMAVVRETAPNALVKDVKQGSVTIGLQTLKHDGFAAMFRKLEEEAEQWGIESFVVTVATMRDAYITYFKKLDAEAHGRYWATLSFGGEELPDPLDDDVVRFAFTSGPRNLPPVTAGDIYLYLVEGV
ncbi:phospholipid-transporting ATPase ABCA3-like [Amblyomma americanum]